MSIVRAAGFLAVAVAVLAGCGKREAADPPADPGATVETMATAGSPGMEGGGPEPPRTGDGGPAVSLPRLPVGDGGEDDETQERQCAVALWAGNDIPGGVSVTVTDVDFDPRGVFAVDGRSCGDRPGCLASFAFTAGDQACSVPVRAVAPSGDTDLVLLTSCTGRCRDIVTSSKSGVVSLSYHPTDETSESSEPSEPTEPTEPTDDTDTTDTTEPTG